MPCTVFVRLVFLVSSARLVTLKQTQMIDAKKKEEHTSSLVDRGESRGSSQKRKKGKDSLHHGARLFQRLLDCSSVINNSRHASHRQAFPTRLAALYVDLSTRRTHGSRSIDLACKKRLEARDLPCSSKTMLHG